MALEHSCYTWDPVSRAWVHERGPEIPPPPEPPDIHALQSYFFDDDSKQWIRTVLAPMGRELAAKWEGAHKIPDDASGRSRGLASTPGAQKKKGGSALGVVFMAVVLLVMLGGAGVVASQNGLLAQVPANVAIPLVHDATAAPSLDVTPAPSASPSPTPVPSPSPSPTPAGGGGGGGGGGVVRTNPPVATIAIPAGPSTKLADGTTAVYTGPTLVLKPTPLAATFTLVAANGRPATGDVTVVLGPTSVPALIDANGRVAVTVPTAAIPPGQYPIQLLSKGALSSAVAFITVR